MPSRKSSHSDSIKKDYESYQKIRVRINDACTHLIEGRTPFEIASKGYLSSKIAKHKHAQQDDADNLKWNIATNLQLLCNFKNETPQWIIKEGLGKALYHLKLAEIPGYLAIVNKSDLERKIKKFRETWFRYSDFRNIFDGYSDPFKSINSFSKAKKRALLHAGALVENNYPGHCLIISNRKPFPSIHYCSILPEVSIGEGGEPIILSTKKGRPKKTDLNFYGFLMNSILLNFVPRPQDHREDSVRKALNQKISVTLAAKECNKLLKKVQTDNVLDIKIERSIESLKDAYELYRKTKAPNK